MCVCVCVCVCVLGGRWECGRVEMRLEKCYFWCARASPACLLAYAPVVAACADRMAFRPPYVFAWLVAILRIRRALLTSLMTLCR